MSRLAGRQGKRAILVAALISASLAGAQNPEGAPSSEQVGVLIRDLQGEVQSRRIAYNTKTVLD